MDGGSTENAGDGSSKDMGGVERWETDTAIAAWSLLLFGSVLLNATLLIAFMRRPGLRTISNRFVMNLIASNLLAIFVLTSLLITNTCQLDAHTWTPSVCALSEGATALVTTSSILSVLLIGIDQYLAVVDPLRYRTRIDKLKCGLLILAVWLIALTFGSLASFNPQPRGLWKLCSPGTLDETQSRDSTNVVEYQDKIREPINESAEAAFPASHAGEPDSAAIKVSYGMVYALLYAVLGYLVPFATMCWIYVSIYMAARHNSERTRRTGSRPVLTSGSFSEESGHRGPDSPSLEDVRRIPKISSLSSIDENSEATPSQAEPPVIFTVGSQDHPAKVPSDRQPVAAAVADHCSGNGAASDESRKNSQDLTYEEMMLGCKHPYEYEDDDLVRSSDEEEEEEEEEEEQQQQQQQQQHRDHHEFEPLSSGDRPAQGSVSVNFDLAESEHSRMLGTPAQPPPIVTITPPGQKPAVPRAPSSKTTHNYIHNLKHRISNGSLFKYREETRAARISALVIVMGLICWTPYVYALLWRNLQSQTARSDKLDGLALGFLVLATYVSPLLFGYRSKRVKRELRKFFCFKRELSYKNNRSLMAKKVLRRRHSGVTILGQLAGDAGIEHSRYNIFNCVYGKSRWPKEKVQFVQVPETALAVETCRSSFSSGASTQISSTSTDEC
ncbi:alpha-2B adrenergic receptor [Phymastichus coffea]|uniref:alpha-2B adrenergic receptor n=1 Tax=Phymastichus coffea TaxID=108790 RepID=UPI00273B550E|nr:alpha-2B adrenergic receptor [Phymastichus coffea]XP_058799356.1 alpha-2B adrenergic receptor [Phymastichus coffea]